MVAAALATAACASDVEPPAPTPAATAASTSVAAQTVAEPSPTPAPAPTPTAPSEPVYENYLDAPQTPGTWAYLNEGEEQLALFGENPGQPIFMVRCGDGVISLGRVTDRAQSGTRVMNVQAETVTRQLEAGPVPQRPIILAADLAPSDTLLDAIAITKGRFMVDVEGEKPLYLPAWVEVSRVIEDCR